MPRARPRTDGARTKARLRIEVATDAGQGLLTMTLRLAPWTRCAATGSNRADGLPKAPEGSRIASQRQRKALLYQSSEVARRNALNCASACFLLASPKPSLGAGKQKAVPKDRFNRFNFLTEIGAGEEIRTLDPNLGKVVLYH